jgi:glutamate racemase
MRIGIFDSGLGGLTVARAIREKIPQADLFYFGDTARVPYGIKSAESVNRYALEIAKYLRFTRNIDVLVAACNTVSATAIPTIVEALQDIKLYDVISAAIELICTSAPQNSHIGVLGTLATIRSGAYENRLNLKRPDLKITSQACPLLVPLAEEGWINHPVAIQSLQIYLAPFLENTPDYLVLGCTHYPLFKEIILDQFVTKKPILVDSADTIAHALAAKQPANNANKQGCMDVTVSDIPQRFELLMERFLGIHADFISRHAF